MTGQSNICLDPSAMPKPIVESEEIQRLKQTLLKDIKRSAYVYRVDCGGCNACEIEIFAAITPIFDAERFGIKVVGSPRHADILVFTGPMTRAMRMPAIRAYHATPDPKICVSFGACGCSGGIFHDLYCTWGGSDKIFPIDVYIPGCPPTPAATLYGFAMALGLLNQKLKANHHTEKDNERAALRYPEIPLQLRTQIEREARQMAGYRMGAHIADRFLSMMSSDANEGLDARIQEYLSGQDDPRQAEIFRNLHQIVVLHNEKEHERIAQQLRIQIERESRRLAGYRIGPDIADQFIFLMEKFPNGDLGARLNAYLSNKKDPLLAKTMARLHQLVQEF